MSHLPVSFEIDGLSKVLELIASDDIKEFFEDERFVTHRFPFGLWFRGHSEVVEEIEPRAFRKRLAGTGAEAGTWDETNVYEHLRVRIPSLEATYRTAFDWLCLMQHYGLPTRLLDWSESILSALFFAVKEDVDANGELVILNAKRLDIKGKFRPTNSSPDDAHVVVRAEMATTRSLKTLKRRKSVLNAIEQDTRGNFTGDDWVENCRRPVAVLPRPLNDRMVFQTSVFTIHGGKAYSDDMHQAYPDDDRMPSPITLHAVDLETPDKPILRRFTISKDAKGSIREELFRLGIHEAMLFPEVERQADYLQTLWWYQTKDV